MELPNHGSARSVAIVIRWEEHCRGHHLLFESISVARHHAALHRTWEI